MSKRYHGKNKLKYIAENSPTSFLIKINVQEINILQKYLEGYENLTFVIPSDPKNGLLLLHTTFELAEELLHVLEKLPLKIELVR